MAKTNGKTIKIIGLVLSIVFVIATFAYGYGCLNTTVTKLDSEGCKPARGNITKIEVMQNDISHIRDTVDEIKMIVKEK